MTTSHTTLRTRSPLFKRASLALLLLLGAVLLLGASPAATVDTIIYTTGGERHYRLEIANTPHSREQGLMHRDDLAPNDGMLFLFEAPSRPGFWMKNTRIPLDMLFIDASYTIAHIETSAEPGSLNMRKPPTPVIAVIELAGGRAATDGIALGDQVKYALAAELQAR